MALSSYLLDHRFRGVGLAAKKIREGIEYITGDAADAIQAPRPTHPAFQVLGGGKFRGNNYVAKEGYSQRNYVPSE